MVQSLRLGRIREVEVKLHPTFGLVVLYVIFNWGSGSAGLDSAAAIFYGLLLVGLVFVCVLLHELGHSFMAMHYGIRVHDVTLSVIGGVARIEHFPARPGTEILIALAGPAVNVAIMVALAPLVLLYGVIQGLSSPWEYLERLFDVSAGGLLLAVFYANAMIVLFNLLPAFPMDGGRILRAGLTLMVGRETGTRTAVLIGQGLAVILAVGSLFWLHSFSTPLIALFIIVVAQAEGRAVRLEGAMRRLRVGQFALWDMGGIAPHQPLTYALRGGPRDVAVTEDGQVVGMLWRNQLLHALRSGTHGMTVADVMDDTVMTADVDESVYDVQQRMNQLNRWAFPVIEDGQYRGIFTADRFVHVYQQLAPFPAAARHVAGFTTNVNQLIRAWTR
jgi:Zn-dependent protease